MKKSMKFTKTSRQTGETQTVSLKDAAEMLAMKGMTMKMAKALVSAGFCFSTQMFDYKPADAEVK